MDATTAGPDRGEITETVDATGVTLGWPAYKADARRTQIPNALALLAWLAFWTFGGVMAVRALVTGRGHPFVVVWLCGWAVAEVFVILKLWEMVRRPTSEFVRLEADRLSYDPGHGPSEARTCAELPDGKVVPVTPAPATEASRGAIRGFGIDRVNDRQRLYFDTDDRRVEIGGCLTESERAWLFAVLQRWLGKPATPRWSPAARRHKEETQS